MIRVLKVIDGERFLSRWFSGFRFCDVECNLKTKHNQPRRQLLQSRHFGGNKKQPLSMFWELGDHWFLIRKFNYLLNSVTFIWIFGYFIQHHIALACWYITRLHYILRVRRSTKTKASAIVFVMRSLWRWSFHYSVHANLFEKIYWGNGHLKLNCTHKICLYAQKKILL